MKPILLLLALTSCLFAEKGVVDLINLHNYANQPVPGYITRDNTPASNPITDLGATLGRVLFHDKRLSFNDTVSCASCHQQQHAFSDLADASTGVAGTTGRHSMRLVNARFGDEVRFFWDERATNLEDQSTRPIRDHVEMGFSGSNGDPSIADLLVKLSAIEEYQVLFTGVYGDPAVTEERMQQALAQFIRSIQSFDSKYDEGRSQAPNDGADFPNFTVAENNGKALFLAPPNQGGAGCAGCHQPPEFSIAPNSGNNGVVGTLAMDGSTDITVTRSPSLRDLVDRDGVPHGAFMHDASLDDLAAVISHYNSIPAVVPGIDPRLTRPGRQPQRLNLSGQERNQLAAFLRTLTGTAVYTDEKWSDPFTESGELSLIVLPATGVRLEANTGEVVVTGSGVPNVTYLLEWCDDCEFESAPSIEVTASPEGVLQVSHTMQAGDGRMFYRFVYEPGLETLP